MRMLSDVEMSAVTGSGLLSATKQATRSVMQHDQAVESAATPEAKEPSSDKPVLPIGPSRPGPCGEDRVCPFFQ